MRNLYLCALLLIVFGVVHSSGPTVLTKRALFHRRNSLERTLYFTSSSRALEVNRSHNDVLQDCRVSSITSSDDLELKHPHVYISEALMTQLVGTCSDIQLQFHLKLTTREKRWSIIYPNTKWCGAGNEAANDTELGSANQTDACCRAHDKCTPSLGPFKTGYGLFNFALWSRLSCDCESTFHTCMKQSSESEAAKIGNLYFNDINSNCMRLQYPRVCEEEGWFSCNKWVEDKTQPPAWEWVEKNMDF